MTQHFRVLSTLDDVYNCVFCNTGDTFNQNFYLFKQFPKTMFENKSLTLMETEGIGDMDCLNSKCY